MLVELGGLGPKVWRWEGLIRWDGRDPTREWNAGRQPEEIMEGRARGFTTTLSASQLGTSPL